MHPLTSSPASEPYENPAEPESYASPRASVGDCALVKKANDETPTRLDLHSP